MNSPKKFTFAANWLRPDSDTAEITLRLGNTVISRVADTRQGTNRDYFRASATSLAFWMADNWWRLRWETVNARIPSNEWRLRHELNSANGGALWPPVMIYSSSDRIAFAPSAGRRPMDGPQTYFDFDFTMVGADEYELELDGFFKIVLEHCAHLKDGPLLRELLGQINTERADPELAAWRRLEACLGFDPDSAPDEVVNGLIDLENVAGEDGVEEAAHAHPGEESAESLRLVIEATRTSTLHVDLSMANVLAKKDIILGRGSPWQMAEAAAVELRQIIGASHGPLSNRILADIFSTRWMELKNATATARNLKYGARIVEGDSSRIALQNTNPRDRRFELVRQLGDAIWCGDSEFGVVSRAKTDRQKFQRAFANSLLCPFDDLERELDVNNLTEEAMRNAAKSFKVNPSIIRNQLVYKGYIPFESAEEFADTV